LGAAAASTPLRENTVRSISAHPAQ
jgi:hypothetical protein